MEIDMRLTLIMTTYNSRQTLLRVLDSYRQQIVMPDEIIIADDGSNDGTAEMIHQMQSNYPCRLLHVWQPDEGFRAARIRNLAAKQASGEYLVFTDGDCMPHPLFISDHHELAHTGRFVAGYRIRLSDGGTSKFSWRGMASLPNIPLSRWRHLLRGLRTPILYETVETYLASHRAVIASCNMAMFREDYVAVNGFDEQFVGWGAEDGELALRLGKYGLQLLVVRYKALVFHLRHPEQSKDRTTTNAALFERSKSSMSYQCSYGLDHQLPL